MITTFHTLLTSLLLLMWAASAHASISKLDPSLLRAWHQPEPQTVTTRAVQNQPQLAALVQLHPEADAAAFERTLQSLTSSPT